MNLAALQTLAAASRSTAMLIAQDPGDEPASVLLARIKQQRDSSVHAENGKIKTRRKRKDPTGPPLEPK